nr:MAG TPA: hypothetical protein [Bacteriophage sp.]
MVGPPDGHKKTPAQPRFEDVRKRFSNVYG